MVQRGSPLELSLLTKSRAAWLQRIKSTGRNSVVWLKAVASRASNEAPPIRQAELNSRVTAAELEVEQSIRQLSQTQIQLASAKDTLAMNQEILNNITPLVKLEHCLAFNTSSSDSKYEQALVAEQLAQEQERLKLAIDEAKSKLQNTIALSRKELLTQMADNDKRIAEIDSQLAKAMVENNLRIAEIDSQLSQTQLTFNIKNSGRLEPSLICNLITQVLSRLPILLFSKLFLMTL